MESSCAAKGGAARSRSWSFFQPSIVKRLLNYKKTDPEKEKRWSEDATKLIITKIKNKRGFAELEKAVTNEGSVATACVRINEATLQVGQRRDLPHVISCRLWRWPDLQSHYQLRPIDTCKDLLSLSTGVCINPYHYMRIEPPVLPPVLVPRNVPVPSLPPPLFDDVLPDSHSWPALNEAPQHTSTFPATEPLHHVEVGTSSCCSRCPSALSEVGSPKMSPSSESASPESSSIFVSDSPGPYYCVVYCEPAYWCSVNYYEMKCHVGDVFHATKPFFIVDGFTNPNSPERFCLGSFTNVYRDATIEQTRCHIGKGVQLMYVGGEVFVESLSTYGIFIHSPIANLIHGHHPAEVYKAKPGSCTKVFSLVTFAQCLKESIPRGFEEVFRLTNMCSIRISFIKGWGAGYQRRTVTSTPCWIEIHLSGALQWLDKVLNQMNPLPEGINSNT